MLASLLLVLTFAATPAATSTTTTLPAPGEGLGLAPAPRPVPEVWPVPLPGWELPTVPPDGTGSGFPGAFTALVALVAGGAAFMAGRSRRGEVAATPPRNVDVVFVPGYGSPATGSFDRLIGQIGLVPSQVHEFDYRTVASGVDHAAASRAAVVDATADGVSRMVAGLEEEGRWIYLVGFSKGGAALAHVIAGWDEHPGSRPARVVGAALLDPPIASGVHGFFQSVGLGHGRLPDDGGYDPIEWSWLRNRDTRVNLGVASGVSTMVIRNTDSFPAGFLDSPPGLRIYDLQDGGDSALWHAPDGAGAVLDRVGEAHTSVRTAAETAECIRAELWQANGCDWPEPPGPPARPLPTYLGRSAGGAGRNLVL